MSCCPISHIPVSELRMPVVFRHELHSVVFDADHLVNWLRSYRLVDPVTNQPIPADLAINILKPSASPDAKTMYFLSRAGFLRGGVPQNSNEVSLETKLKSDAAILITYATLEYAQNLLTATSEANSWLSVCISIQTFVAISLKIFSHYPINGGWILLILFSGATALAVSSEMMQIFSSTAGVFDKFQVLLFVLSTIKVVLDLATGCGARIF